MPLPNTQWHAQADTAVITGLGTNATAGLLSGDAGQRLERYGPNMFTHEQGVTLFGRLIGQLKSPLVLILLVAGVATLALGHNVDSTVIFIALVINVSIGLFQEGRADKAFARLAASQEQYAFVIRDGRKRRMHARDIVPGDLVELTAGMTIPADVRLLSAQNFSVNESALTGEWLSVDKQIGVVSPKARITEQENMAWMGTLTTSGVAQGVVVATGSRTQLGRVAESLQTTEETRTPLQKSVHSLAIFISYLVGLIVLIIVGFGIFRGLPVGEMLLLAIAVAVSVIPEGLPAAVTAVLAIGMERVLGRGGLVRNLLAAETLGSTSVILTDKTGTLTQAKMKLQDVVTLSGSEEDAHRTLELAVLASDAFVESEEGGKVAFRGRPMEQAIVQAGLAQGISQKKLAQTHTMHETLPFDSERRYAARRYTDESEHREEIAFSGAPELFVERAGYILKDGKAVAITEADRVHITEQLQKHAGEGSRLIATGYTTPKKGHTMGKKGMTNDLVFAGLLGFADPVREDVPQAMKEAKSAGAHIIMLTGDNAVTARSIAHDAGVTTSNTVITGEEVEDMSDKELREKLKSVQIFARVLPSQKLRIARILQGQGHVVAMTGDGINDAPALRRADIGIAVGTGTDVAKEASDLVLINNSFAIIVAAIREGRRIIDNLKKVVTHLLSTSFHEIFIIVFSILFGFPLPILPVQILWVNILQEGFLNFGFAFEPGEKDIMKRNPQDKHARTILTKEVRTLIITAGTITGFFTLGLFLWLLWQSFPIEEIRTIMFVVLSLDSILFAVSLKNLHKPFWRTSLFNNTYLLFALLMSATGLVATLALPVLRDFLSLVKLESIDIAILAGVALFNIITIEFSKNFVFRKA